MKRFALSFFSCLLLTLGAHAQNGGVAVLDIDAVAAELGVEDSVRVELQTLQNNLNTELQNARANLQQQMATAEQAVGESPTDQQRQQLLQTNQQLNAQFNQLQAQARQTIAQERAQKINEFRDKLRPIALEAAKDKGLDVVLMRVTPPVFGFTDAVDITEDTTRRAKEAGLEAAVPAAPPRATPTNDKAGKGNPKGKGGE